jgi:acetolactate synthase-1/2/3 large subunit
LGLASMGSALGASIGAATVWRDRAVICICGDGAALMHGTELKTIAEYGIPLKVVILNDGGYGMVHHGSRLIGLVNTKVRYRRTVDFRSVAAALGLASRSVVDEEQWQSSALEELLALQAPALLDVWIDPTVEPPILDRAHVLERTESA